MWKCKAQREDHVWPQGYQGQEIWVWIIQKVNGWGKHRIQCSESWFCILFIDLLAFYHGSLALVSVVKGALHNVWFLLKWPWNTSSGCCSLSWGMDWKELQAPAEELQSIWFQGLSACAENNVSVQQQCRQRVLEEICCVYSSRAGWVLRSCWVTARASLVTVKLSLFIYSPYFLLPSWQ